MLSCIYLPFSLGLNITEYDLEYIYMYADSLSRKLLENSQFENLTLSQITFREISSLNRISLL